MSAFNMLLAAAPCPRCTRVFDVEIQFKYGDVWQHRYRLHDVLQWGGNEYGVRWPGRVVVEGTAASACPECGFDGEWDLYIHLVDDVFVAVTVADGTHDFSDCHAIRLCRSDESR